MTDITVTEGVMCAKYPCYLLSRAVKRNWSNLAEIISGTTHRYQVLDYAAVFRKSAFYLVSNRTDITLVVKNRFCIDLQNCITDLLAKIFMDDLYLVKKDRNFVPAYPSEVFNLAKNRDTTECDMTKKCDLQSRAQKRR